MIHPQRRRCAVAGLALLLLATLSACVTNPQPASSPTPAPVTARALAALVGQHFGPGTIAYSDHEDEAVVLYGTDPWAPTRKVRMTYGEAPWWATNDAACRDAGTGTPPVQCALRHGVRIGWQSDLDTVWVASPRARGVVTAALGNVRLSQDPRQGELPEDLVTLIALAEDPRADATTVAGHLSVTTPWTDDPACSSAPLTPLATAPARSAQAAERPTPRAFIAMIAERVRGICGWGSVVEDASTPQVTGTLYLGPGDVERVTAAVTRKAPACKGMDACEKRGARTIAWQFDVPEEYPATVRVSRAIPGGHLVITHTSQHADDKTRRFPVPLETLLALAGDDRFGFAVDPALNVAGDDLSLCWRLTEPTDG